jgi:hypothetical protein
LIRVAWEMCRLRCSVRCRIMPNGIFVGEVVFAGKSACTMCMRDLDESA